MIQQIWPRLRQGLPSTLIFTGSAAFAGLVAGLVLARTLGPEGRGQFATIVLWPTLLSIVGELGLGFAFSYFAGRNRQAVNGLWSLAWVVALGVGGVVGLMGLAVLPGQVGLTGTALTALKWNLVIVPTALLSGYLSYLLLGTGHLLEYNLVRLTNAACYSLGIVGVAVAGAAGIGPYTVVFIMAQFAGLLLALGLTVARLHPAWAWEPPLVKQALRYGFKTYVSTLMGQANLRVDQVIMTLVVAPAQLGYYVVSVAVAGLVSPLYSAIAIVVLPRVTRAADHHLGGAEALRHVRFIVLGGVPLTAALGVAMPLLLPLLFGADYGPSIWPAQILLVAGLLQGGVITLANSLRGLGLPGRAAISEGIGLMATIGLLFSLLPVWGIVGAAVASLVAYGIVALLQLVFVFRASGTGWADLWRLPSAATAGERPS
jgi:O-antigen/teichoic acid export membrane protein